MNSYEKTLQERRKRTSKFYQKYGVTKQKLARIFNVCIDYVNGAEVTENGDTIEIRRKAGNIESVLVYDFVNRKKISKTIKEEKVYK